MNLYGLPQHNQRLRRDSPLRRSNSPDIRAVPFEQSFVENRNPNIKVFNMSHMDAELASLDPDL